MNWLRGVEENSEPVKFTGITDRTDFALTVRNRDGALNDPLFGKALAVQNSAGKILLEVANYGIIMRPTADGDDILKIRNYADDADVFTISTTGASLGGSGDVVTTSDTQTLTNKTLTAAILNAGRVGNFLDIDQGSAPANPTAGDLRLYALTGSSLLRVRNSVGVEKTFVDGDSSQTVANKTINTSSLNSPVITQGILADYTTMNDRVSVIPNPGATAAILYKNSGSPTVSFKSGNNNERTVVDTDSSQTLISKTFTAPIMNNPTVNEIFTLNDKTVAAPTIDAESAAIYKTAADASLKFKAGNNTERTIVDTDSAQVLTNKIITITSLTGTTLNNPLVSNYVGFTHGSNPGGTANTARLWSSNDGNMYFTGPSGTSTTILTSSNTSIASSLGFARSLSLGGL